MAILRMAAMALPFFNNQDISPQPGKPKAYLNVIFFDDQFKMDATASKFQQVGTGDMNANNPGQIGFMAGSAALAQKIKFPITIQKD